MTELNTDGMFIEAQDLSSISPSSDDDDRMFHHDGSSSISMVGGGTNSQRGYYVWEHEDGAWSPVFNNADLLDGMESGEFVYRDGSLPMQGDLDLDDSYGLINVNTLGGNTGEVDLNSNSLGINALSSGASVQINDSNGLLLIDAQEGGVVNVPNTLNEGGNRVATRAWTNANADVPNADYADNANNLDGYNASAFLQVSGDQMEGVLDLGQNNIEDGSDVVWDASSNEVPQSSLGGPASSLSSFPLSNSDLSNSTVSVAGNSVSLGGSITPSVSDFSAATADVDLGSSKMVRNAAGNSAVMTFDSTDDSWLAFDFTSSGGGNYADFRYEYTPGNRLVGFKNKSNGRFPFTVKPGGDLLADNENKTLWDNSNNEVPQEILGGPAASLNAYPLANSDLSNSAVTVTAGTGIASGGTASLGGSLTVDVDDSRYVLESGDTMSGGLTLGGTLDVAANDLVDGSTTVWDTSLGAVPQSVLGGPAASLNAYPLQNSDLSNSTVSVAGNSVGLGGSTSVALGDLSNVTATGEGAGNGFDADLLDGVHKSDLDSQYVDAAGDKMTGSLIVGSDSNNEGLKLNGSGSDNHITRNNGNTLNLIVDSDNNQTEGNFSFYHDGFVNSGTEELLFEITDTGVNSPNTTLSEYGDRVATRTWTDNNADVPNADYADSAGDADTLDGEHAASVSETATSDLTFDVAAFSAPVTKWSDGLSNEEIHRVELNTGESLEVHRLEIEEKGGGSYSGLNVEVYDVSNATSLASTTDVATGSPINTSSDGATVIVRLTNTTGSYKNASINGSFYVV